MLFDRKILTFVANKDYMRTKKQTTEPTETSKPKKEQKTALKAIGDMTVISLLEQANELGIKHKDIVAVIASTNTKGYFMIYENAE